MTPPVLALLLVSLTTRKLGRAEGTLLWVLWPQQRPHSRPDAAAGSWAVTGLGNPGGNTGNVNREENTEHAAQ